MGQGTEMARIRILTTVSMMGSGSKITSQAKVCSNTQMRLNILATGRTIFGVE